jgi:hypothetical protein
MAAGGGDHGVQPRPRRPLFPRQLRHLVMALASALFIALAPVSLFQLVAAFPDAGKRLPPAAAAAVRGIARRPLCESGPTVEVISVAAGQI